MMNILQKMLLALLPIGLLYSPVAAEAKAKKRPQKPQDYLPMKEEARPMMAVPRPSYPKVQAVKLEGSISMDDYPAEPLDNYEEGRAQANIAVSPTGEVASCTASGATPRLNQYTCTLIKQRFKYKPAEGYDGKPMLGLQTQFVLWRLDLAPGDEFIRTAKMFANAYSRTITLDVDAKGKVSGCAISGGEPNASRDGFVCSLAKDQWTFVAALDEKNKPASSILSFAPDLPLPDPPKQDTAAPANP
jgi:hypothetical protein